MYLLNVSINAVGRDRRVPDIANCSPDANIRAYVGLIHFVINIMRRVQKTNPKMLDLQ